MNLIHMNNTITKGFLTNTDCEMGTNLMNILGI
eukprot:UN04277